MTPREPVGPYVFQPFGSLTHPEHETIGRLWGVGGVSLFTTITGLTKAEADAIVAALQSLREALIR